VEGEIVFVVLQACVGAEDALGGGDGLFVDPGGDGEVFHGFHGRGADFEEGVVGEGGGEVGGGRVVWHGEGC